MYDYTRDMRGSSNTKFICHKYLTREKSQKKYEIILSYIFIIILEKIKFCLIINYNVKNIVIY